MEKAKAASGQAKAGAYRPSRAGTALLCNELEILAEDNVLEELRINVFSPRTVIRTGEDWGLLDNVLSRPGAFKALRKVRVGIRVMLLNRLSVERFEELKSVPTKQFPSLSTNPLIDLKFWVGID